MTQDRLTVLSGMRPQTSLDTVWTADEPSVVRERILADRNSPANAGPHRRRRAALAGVVALGLIAVPGVATAVGSGMKPQAFFDAYDYWDDNPRGSVNPATASRAATAPGPFGGTFSVLTATNEDGLTCIGPVFESSTSAKAELPDNFEDGGSFCHSAPSTRPFGLDSIVYTDSATVWWAHAGDAVTAELRMPSGEVYPVVRVEGYLFGWYPLPLRGPDEAPTLTGYAADGSALGKIRI